MRKAAKKLFWFYFILFFIAICYLINFSFIEANSIVSNSYNPRLSRIDSSIKRGSILDKNNEVLAESIEGDNGYMRVYNYPVNFCHIIGYTQNGMSGIEAKNNFTLQNPTNELFQRIKALFTDDPVKGDSIILTVDKDLQQSAANLLGTSKGSIVIMEPSTGKVLAMVSYPNYDTSKITDNWAELSTDNENNPLLNRATQGLYPPGSTFKIITAATAIENISDWQTFTYDCAGTATFGDKLIHCFDSNAHGNVDIYSAMSKSCNTYFSALGNRVGSESLRATAERAMFNRPLDFSLEYNQASFALNKESSQSELTETSIGQGKTLVTPLYMAMLTSSVANNGIMMRPYIIDHIEAYNGISKNKTIPSMLAQPFSTDTAHILSNAMEGVVTSGTAIQASLWDTSVAGKTGTAENASGKDHAWFVAFAPVESPKVVVAVILENAGTGSKSVPIARELIKEYLAKYN